MTKIELDDVLNIIDNEFRGLDFNQIGVSVRLHSRLTRRIKQLANQSQDNAIPVKSDRIISDHAEKQGLVRQDTPSPDTNNNVCKNCEHPKNEHIAFKHECLHGLHTDFECACNKFEPKESLNRSCAK